MSEHIGDSAEYQLGYEMGLVRAIATVEAIARDNPGHAGVLAVIVDALRAVESPGGEEMKRRFFRRVAAMHAAAIVPGPDEGLVDSD